jgi:trehalose 6-phosphate phosphatase
VLAFDFDGTLAPIVAEPRKAALRTRTRRLLRSLAKRRPCLVLSGRSLADLEPRLSGIELLELVGNHGATRRRGSRPDAAALERAAAWRAVLERRLAGKRGVVVEDNGVSLAVHYRRAPDRAAARRSIRRVVASLAGARPLDGKCVVNVLPREAPDKGLALARVCRRRAVRAALYVGDDLTDESAFNAAVAPCFVTIRVGRAQRSTAAYCLRDQREVDELLAFLLQLEPPIPGHQLG